MKNTLRILVSWECNLNCIYCCNNQPQFRKDITPTAFEDIQWQDYENFCITGGEPLLNMPLVKKCLNKIPKGKTVILYTNGFLLTPLNAAELALGGVQYVNVGMHSPATFEALIRQSLFAVHHTTLNVRFHAQDIYETELRAKFPKINFRFWKMDDCDRGNEDRIVLKKD
jgi:molybdenum cofactor biosynthesis enzyme MoaA